MRRMLILIITMSACSFADSGLSFLRTEKTPEIISTAQTSYLFSGTAANSGYNPGSVLGSQTFEGRVSYSSPEQDESVIDLSGSYSDQKTLYGFQISYMNISDLDGREVPSDEPAYKFDSRNLIASFTYARNIIYGINAGITGKYIFEKIEYDDASGFALSAGIFRENIFLDGLNVGLAVNNIGSMDKLDKESSDLPSDLLFGTGYRDYFADNFTLSAANSARYLLKDGSLENFTGLELAYQDMVFIRFGYRAHNDGMPFSTGLGFLLNNISFDYSYTPFSDDAISDAHAVSVGYSFRKNSGEGK